MRDKNGNPVYPRPHYIEVNGRTVEISDPPIYFYMPVPVAEPKDGEGTEGKEDQGRDQ